MPNLNDVLPSASQDFPAVDRGREQAKENIKVIKSVFVDVFDIKKIKSKKIDKALLSGSEKILHHLLSIPPKPRGAEVKGWAKDNEIALSQCSEIYKAAKAVFDHAVFLTAPETTEIKKAYEHILKNKLQDTFKRNLDDTYNSDIPVGIQTLDFPIDNLEKLAQTLIEKSKFQDDADEIDGINSQINNLVKHLDCLDNILQRPNIEEIIGEISELDDLLAFQLHHLSSYLKHHRLNGIRHWFSFLKSDDLRGFGEGLKEEISKLNHLSPKGAFLKFCAYESMIDLWTGKLHRLDPVIRDAGCQWRIPFIIDLKYASKDFKLEKPESHIASYEEAMKSNNIPSTMEFMGNLVSDDGEIDDVGFSCNKRPEAGFLHLRSKIIVKLPDNLYTKIEHFPYHKAIEFVPDGFKKLYDDFCVELNTLNISNIWKFHSKGKPFTLSDDDLPLMSLWQTVDIKEAPELHEAALAEEDDVKDQGVILPSSPACIYQQVATGPCEDRPKQITQSNLSTSEYLAMCKALTVRQIRYMDKFGLSSHSIPLTLPYFSGLDFEDYQASLAIYSTRYLKGAFTAMLELPKLHGKGGSMAADLVSMINKLRTPFYKITRSRGPVLSYYENKRLMYMYLFLRNIPIVLDVKRLSYRKTGQNRAGDKAPASVMRGADLAIEAQHSYSGGNVYLFVPDHEAGRYRWEKNPSKELSSTPALCVETYSMFCQGEEANKECEQVARLANINLKDPSKYEEFEGFIKSMDLIDMFLITTIYHSAFPNDTVLIGDDGLKTGLDLTEESLLSFSNADDASIDGIAVDGRPALPMFGNEFQRQPWNIKKEKAFIKAANPLKKYAAKSDLSDDKLLTARAALTYPLGCIHLYACSYNDMREKFKNQEAMRIKHLGANYENRLSDVLDIVDCEKLIF
ncbi:hypothetical protein GUA87_09535 [Sneathiella sp. P13V-1]|uniref:hypothetical protein n=1 Tax=Sneathiella sp. P13V-1 TaxID=2697366 RepID=UPI00187B8DA6|nr:hypothetical protein [Sneathiella sp. P13V-1]MBE7637083.1 hypothetical protein [Sneathiella sp. P13V-1]